MKQLELGWNNKITLDKQSRRMLTYGEDIRDFLNKSMTPKMGSGSPVGFGATTVLFTDSPEREAARTQEMGGLGSDDDDRFEDTDKKTRSSAIFETIASTFNFQHHEGTDEEIELKMIKCIVMRESLLMKLKHFVDRVEVRNPYGEVSLKPSAGSKILDLMIQIRSVTLDYLDNLHRWRLSDKNHDMTANIDNPKVFVWEGYNYTMKIVSDLDFLCEKVALVSALGQQPDKMRANPLMLQGTLEETADTWIDPAMRASMDANNATSGEVFEERLRLRNAERMLLLEIEVNSMFVPQGGMASQASSTVGGNGQQMPGMMDSGEMMRMVKESGDISEGQFHKMLSWRQEAGEQLTYLDPKNADYLAAQEHLRPKNTGASNTGGKKNSSRKGGGGSPEKGESETKVGEKGGKDSSLPQQRGQKSWNQQAEIFPEVDIDSGMPFYENFDKEEKVIPLSDMGKYDEFLAGDNVLESEDFINSVNNYGDQLGYNRVGSVEGTAGENFKAHSRKNRHRDRAPGQDLKQDSALSMNSSHATIDAVSQFDLEAMAKLANPPRSVILAGAICVIILSTEADIPADVSWEAFCKLALLSSPVGTMNTLDPLCDIPSFKIRAIRPFLERLTLVKNPGQGGAPPQGGSSPGSSLVDALGSINSLDSYGVDVPLEALESIEKVFRWIRQMTTATTKGKKRKQTKGSKGASQVLPPLDSSGKPGSSGAGDTKKEKLAAKKADQSMAASRMMGGKTSTIKPKKTKKLASVDTLWPVHTEILENLYRHPLLLTVLSSQGASGTNASKAQILKTKKMLLMVDPLNIAGNGMDMPPERIIVKVYNLVDSNEATINLNIREFTLFLYELREKYGSEVSEYYRPASVLWWVENLRNIISVKARADKKLMILVSKHAIERIVMQALGLYQSPKKGTGGGMMAGPGGGSMSSQDSSMDLPLGNLSMPGELPLSTFNDSSTRKQGHQDPPQQLELNEWDFYDADFEAAPTSQGATGGTTSGGPTGTGTGGSGSGRGRGRGRGRGSAGASGVEPKLSRQDMRNNFDATGNPLQGSDQRTRSRNDGKPGGKSAKGKTNSGSDSGSADQQAEMQKRQKAEMKALQEQQQLRNQQQHMLPEGLDYGEDVFEDDGEGEFEAEVARAQQLSRSISREKPLSAPGSLSAPHSMSSLPSRHASDVEVVGRVDSNADAPYPIDDIAEQSNENQDSIASIDRTETTERMAKKEREVRSENGDGDIDSEMPLYGEPEDDIDLSINLDSKPNSRSGSKTPTREGSAKFRSDKNRNTDDVLDAVLSMEEPAMEADTASVRSEVSAALDQMASEVAED